MIKKLLLNTQMMDGIYKNIEGCNPNKKQKILIIFDDMIAVICLVIKNLIQ